MVVLFLVTFVLEDFLPQNGDSGMHLTLQIIEYICVTFFTVEYSLRFLCSPKKIRFLKNPVNLVDLLAIIPCYFDLILDQMNDVAILGKAGKAIRLSRILRVIRIFKLVRHFAGLQSIFCTLKQAYKVTHRPVMFTK